MKQQKGTSTFIFNHSNFLFAFIMMKGDLVDSLRWTLLFGKYTGLMPLVGLKQSGDTFSFTWKSIYMLIYIPTLMIQGWAIFIQLLGFICSEYRIIRLNSLVFFGGNFTLSLLYLRFCQRSKDFLKSVQELEKYLPRARKPQCSIKTTNKLMGVILLITIVDHILYLIYTGYITQLCFILPEDSGFYMKSYYKLVYYWYFEFFEFSYTAATVLQFIKLQGSIVWIYADIFVMVICIYLKNRFQDFNSLIINENDLFTKRFVPTWSELQVHYTRISKLVKIVDDNINAIVFVSLASNLYQICLQTYFIINKLLGINNVESSYCAGEHKYDFITLLFKTEGMTFLLARTALMCYLAAEVNVASRVPLMALHSVPSTAYNADMRRLMTQVYHSKVAVTGLNFFRVTRGMILAMLAELLTYELVVAQLD